MGRREDVEPVTAGVEEPLHADEVTNLPQGATADDARDEVFRELRKDSSHLTRQQQQQVKVCTDRFCRVPSDPTDGRYPW